ncbi:CotH kinase family protein [Winogradskyella sediminis]|uniref:CotH kinase family protein n=1 Tax=Winogradskyella sediminis TaxID=1382466 RepID=UPI000E249857|nr:CotH kinase family protein [Winogradskyella sediminis]REG87323.1 CotH protein [Winogradskyella sediminis]
MKRLRTIMTLVTVVILSSITTLTFNACSSDDDGTTTTGEDENEEIINDADFEATDWTTETHSKDADPNFEEVFEDNTVKRIDIVIESSRWESMLDDMTDLYGTFGSGNGSFSDDDEDPIFMPAEVFYKDIEWYRVGVRFKGNSSLASSWASGILKLSLKLDFDEFEDDYPQIDNQRFYGFKKLSLKNNYNDKSQLREKVAGDVFRNAGLVGSHTAFYTVYIDHGDGPIYFGLYTMVEEVDDTVIDTQFSDNDGNLYKPDGDAASFAYGTYDEDEFVKKTNEDDADFSDVESLYTYLNANTRTTDPATWRANLESVLDTDVFLKYLATNTVIQNWDTYGRMTHNYYLYNDEDTNKLNWIPWDNNEALQTGNMGGALALDFSGLNSAEWPLIGYLYADDVYKAQYNSYVQEVIDGAFNVNTIQAQYAAYADLIEPYVTAEIDGYSFLNSSSEFQSAVNTLNAHAGSRATAVNSYLNGQ